MWLMFALSPTDLTSFETRAGAAATLLRTLANERRLLILCQLGEGELSVGALQQRLRLSQSVLSQHLAVLRDEGVVATRRQSQTIFYRIANPAAAQLMATLAAIYCPIKPEDGEKS
jgi:ArsR family transcriptional regulator, virulence genes transcriptional regulator